MSELTLSRIWQEGLLADEMRTIDGRRLRIVYRGVWTYADGPDFRDAMVELDGGLVQGAIELHLRSSDWQRHWHDRDPSYDQVVLHAVLDDDLPAPASGPSGRPIATVRLRDFLTAPLESLSWDVAGRPLGLVSGQACLPTLAGGRDDLIRAVLRREGWRRLVNKQSGLRQSLEHEPAGEVLKRGILDALGLMHNRDGMAAVAGRVPLVTLEAAASLGPTGVRGLTLAAGGFLPLSPRHSLLAGLEPGEVVEIERAGDELSRRWRIPPVAGDGWVLNRVRPANHPVRRLLAFADIMYAASRDGIVGTVLSMTTGRPDAWRTWLLNSSPLLGRSRADQIVINVFAPFAAAFADATSDADLADRVGSLWERLPGMADDQIARATLEQICGEAPIRLRLAIEVQGLHHIGREGCRVLRCFECPIAMLAATHESRPDGSGVREATDV